MNPKSKLLSYPLIASCAALVLPMAAEGRTKPAQAPAAVAAAPAPVHTGQSVSVPVTELIFRRSGVVTEAGELTTAQGFGDMSKGRHGTIVKLPAGFVSPVHAHTQDYYAIVISGVVVNNQPGQTDVPLATGSYWFQRGEENHVTKCISKVECVFVTNQSDKFDFIFPK